MAHRTLAFRAFPKTAPAQRDLLSRDQVIDGLPEGDSRIRVRHAKPKSLVDAVNAALELEAIKRVIDKLVTSNICRLQVDHGVSASCDDIDKYGAN